MSRARFPSLARLKSRAEFLRVQNGGKKRHLRFFLVFVLRRGPPSSSTEHGPEGELQREEIVAPTRLGITVTRKVGNAVERNRIKRLLRDVFRQEREQLPDGFDMVWVAKRQALGLTHAQVSADFQQFRRTLARDAGLPGESQVQAEPAEKAAQAAKAASQETSS